jgi:acyl-CoA thioesterase-1
MFALFCKQATAAIAAARRIAPVAAVLMLVLMVAPALAAGKPVTIVALGDSLTAGYLLGPGEGFVPQLQKALGARGHDNVTIVDAGVSGDTSSGGLARLDWSVGREADGVIVELGANDALRGVDPQLTKANLEAIVARLQARGLPILLAGMLAPPNMGKAYGQAFDAIYPELAEKHRLVFYPFFLDGAAGQSKLTLDDGMHPNAKGIALMVSRILPSVEKLIDRIDKAKAGG